MSSPKKTSALFLSLVLSAPGLSGAAYCGSSPDPGERTNEFPIFDEAPTFVKYDRTHAPHTTPSINIGL